MGIKVKKKSRYRYKSHTILQGVKLFLPCKRLNLLPQVTFTIETISEKSHHKDIKFIKTAKWRLHGFPQGQDEADSREGSLAS